MSTYRVKLGFALSEVIGCDVGELDERFGPIVGSLEADELVIQARCQLSRHLDLVTFSLEVEARDPLTANVLAPLRLRAAVRQVEGWVPDWDDRWFGAMVTASAAERVA